MKVRKDGVLEAQPFSTSLTATVFRGTAAPINGATSTLISETVVDFRFQDLVLGGTADGLWYVYLDGLIIHIEVTNIARPSALMTLPIAELMSGVLEVKVTNTSDAVASYYATIHGT